MPTTVLADPQFGIVRILRPFSGFEAVYQGQDVQRRIMFTEVSTGPGGDPIDQLASQGTTGYDSKLIRGISVPIGARVVLWIPKFEPNIVVASPALAMRYRYTISWRLRNIFDFRQIRTPYHYPKQGQGVPDTSVVPNLPRVVLPAADQSTIYVQAEPADQTATVAQNIRSEDVSPGGVYPGASQGLPFLPDGTTGIYQQGLLDPGAAFGGAIRAQVPLFQVHEFQAVADELLIGVWRTDPGGFANWDFAQPGGSDRDVGLFYGAGQTTPAEGPFKDIGIYVMVGSAP